MNFKTVVFGMVLAVLVFISGLAYADWWPETRGMVFPGKMAWFADIEGEGVVKIRTIKFDADGLIISDVWADPSYVGKFPKFILIYDASGNRVARNNYKADGTLKSYTYYNVPVADAAQRLGISPVEFHSDQMPAKAEHITSGGVVLRTFIADAGYQVYLSITVHDVSHELDLPSSVKGYDSAGRPIALNRYDGAGNLVSYDIYHYDDASYTSRITSCDYYVRDTASGRLELSHQMFYWYDPGSGVRFKLRKVEYRNGAAYRITIFAPLDDEGNTWVRRIENYDGGHIVNAREYGWIAGEARIVLIEEAFNSEGVPGKKIIYRYNEDGTLAAKVGRQVLVRVDSSYLATEERGYINIDGVDKVRNVVVYGIARDEDWTIPYNYIMHTRDYVYEEDGAAHYITTFYSPPPDYDSRHDQHITHSVTDRGERTRYRYDGTTGNDLAIQTRDSAGNIKYRYQYLLPPGSTAIERTRVMDPDGNILYEVEGLLDVGWFLLTGEVRGDEGDRNKEQEKDFEQKTAAINNKRGQPTYGLVTKGDVTTILTQQDQK